MNRRIVIVLLLLISGAIVNVAVAWGCAYHQPLEALKSVVVARSLSAEWTIDRQLDQFDDITFSR